MKTVVSPAQVAHLWANQIQDEAKNPGHNFWFKKDTIYSYGYHFPIAIHYKGIVLFTLQTYSNTTAKHIQAVRSAVSHKDKLYCYYVEDAKNGQHQRNIDAWLSNIDREAKKLLNARKPQIYLSKIEYQKDQLIKYVEFFKVKLTVAQKSKISFTNADEYKEAVIIAKKKQDKANFSTLATGKKVYNQRLIEWHKGTEYDFEKGLSQKQKDAANFYFRSIGGNDRNTTFLRFVDTQIETSKGIKMPVDTARRFYDYYIRIVKSGGCNDNCNYKMLDYEVKSATADGLVIGCHDISSEEISLLAAKLGWL